MDTIQVKLVEQIDRAIQDYDSYKSQRQTALGEQMLGRFLSSALAVIDRAAGPDSSYAKEAARHIEVLKSYSASSLMVGTMAQLKDNSIEQLVGVLFSLRHDVAAGFVASVREQIHEEVFADFLEEAQRLLDENHKDAAAVIAGGVLETHLRALCAKYGIDTQFDKDGESRPKRASQLNDELKKQAVYQSMDHKGVMQWLELRNKAAHARYGEYEAQQVALMIQSITDFITRNPA